jgi:hypothetical protein
MAALARGAVRKAAVLSSSLRSLRMSTSLAKGEPTFNQSVEMYFDEVRTTADCNTIPTQRLRREKESRRAPLMKEKEREENGTSHPMWFFVFV